MKTFLKNFLSVYISFNTVGFILAVYKSFNYIISNEVWEGFMLHLLYTIPLALIFTVLFFVARFFKPTFFNNTKILIFLSILAYLITLLSSEIYPDYLFVSVLGSYLIVIFGYSFFKLIFKK